MSGGAVNAACVAVRAQMLQHVAEANGLDVDDLWRHVIACGLLTELLVEDDAARDVRAAAYSAGLLHQPMRQLGYLPRAIYSHLA